MAIDYTFEDTWTQPGNNAIDGRFHDGAFLAMQPSAAPISSYRGGVLPTAYSGGEYIDLKIVPDSPTPSMRVRSNLGQSVISRAGQGPWVSTLRSTGVVDLDPSSTTNGRRDLVCAQVLDASIGDAETRTRLMRVTGSPSSTPQLPALPNGAIPLAEISVPANATQITAANIIDLRKAAGIRGGIRLMLPGDSAADPGAYPGDARYRNGQVEVWGTDNRWHGTTPIAHTPVRGATATGGTHTGSPTAMVFTIPDPGWPYYIKASGAMTWDQGIDTVYYPEIRTAAGTIIARGQSVGVNQPQSVGNNRFGSIPVNRAPDTFTGPTTVSLVMQRDGASTNPEAGVIFFDTPQFNYLAIEVIPA